MLTTFVSTIASISRNFVIKQCAGKNARRPGFGFSAEDLADAELTTAYNNFSIQHTLQKRMQQPNNDVASMTSSFSNMMGSGMAQALTNQISSSIPSPSGGNMPMITLQGFIDITTVEVLHDPSKGWIDLNRALQAYNLPIWKEKGDIPRNMLPEYPPQSVLDRVKVITEKARRDAEEKLAAKHAELALSQAGQQAATDLTDDRRYVYRY